MKTILLKSSFLLLFAVIIGLQSFKTYHTENITIKGKVMDQSLKPITGANIFVEESKKGTITDIEGKFELRIASNTKSLQILASGYKPEKLELIGKEYYDVILKKAEKPIYQDKEALYESEITEHAVKAYKGKISLSDDAGPVPSPPAKASPYMDSPRSEVKEAEGTRHEYSKSEKRVKSEAAGQLTAGEWNDLNHWDAWKKLIADEDFKEMESYWELNMRNRYSVYVSNQYELPISDCEVILKSGKDIIWSTKTDNSGKAELWGNKGLSEASITVRSSKNKKVISKVKNISQGVNRVKFEEECHATPTADIMFVVDATGSMGDEIEFLKSELNDVIQQVESSRSTVDFRWGSVFYRDASDNYLTRQSPLSDDEDKVVNFIKMQGAGGGGDYPEAVNEGLEEALMQDWSINAISRIIFLVLDAPPHHNPEVVSELESQIELASSMGIKIIPITASGINRQTEFLMKFMSIMTNGTYVFLTDHSGIGNTHLDPVVKDYEVEKLNDLLIRLINNYSDPGRCAEQSEDDPVFTQIEIYPNPAVSHVQVKIPKGVKQISLSTSSGQIVYKETVSNQEEISLDLSAYIDGMYLVNFYTDDKTYSYKLIKSGKV